MSLTQCLYTSKHCLGSHERRKLENFHYHLSRGTFLDCVPYVNPQSGCEEMCGRTIDRTVDQFLRLRIQV